MSWSSYGREGRSEFNRLYVSSLIASVESQVERHRAKGQRLRLRRAERRLAELRQLPVPATAHQSQAEATDDGRPVGVLRVATVAWLCSGAMLAVCVALRLEAGVTAVADLALLALTLMWFLLAVACSPRDS
jgi:hypothetical protein